jgi:hypothetical protein
MERREFQLEIDGFFSPTGLSTGSGRMIFPMDADVLAELQEALRERMAVVGNRELYERDAQEHLNQLMKASARVDEAARRLGPGADPMLRHYLERQSYLKAIDWLEARAG